MVNQLREKLSSIHPLSRRDAVQMISEFGERVNIGLGKQVGLSQKKYFRFSPFVIAIIESVIWANYAKRSPETFELIGSYLVNDNKRVFEKIDKIRWRYRKGNLKNLLQGWKLLYSNLGCQLFDKDFKAKELVEFQRSAKERMMQLWDKGWKSSIGPWTFYAPFKVVAVGNQRLWKDKELDKVTLPLGNPVIDGLAFLSSLGIREFERQNKQIGNDTDKFEKIETEHEYEKEMAALVKTRVIHINTGLHILGEESFED